MTEYTELKPLLDACRAENCDGPREFRKAVEALFDVCTVETISALIAEIERLSTECKQLILLECHGGTAEAAINLLAERDQLKAENDAARKDLQNLRTDNAQLIYALKQEEQSYLVLRAERDRLKAESEALRDDIEQNQYDANAWRNGEESVWIEVFNSEGDDPFISAISGQITVEQLGLIQAEILEYREDYFEKGSGLYVFRCAHYQAHHDNVGMTEPAHWETDFESYSPFPWEEEAAAMANGGQS
ncbi:hypothetical protein [Pseudomonas yamanorum]|uniref:Uncharacterized protein n=1 Tax=Pseudomonas yamanorum TaxID=515393 RepID=A0AAJ3H5Z8_9PSED|nr:hypothetical protein [Pseudomonas yamanorum]NWD44193.1 hypothetical protein [Pseudomonas yamanorum]